MALTVPHLIAGASAERGVAGLMRVIQKHLVMMNTATLEPYEVLNRAMLTGLIDQPGSSHPEDDRCLLSRLRAVAINSGDVVIEQVYERVPPVTFEDNTATCTVRTMNLPGTRRQIMASYTGTGWPGGSLKRACNVTYRCPVRKLVIGKALFGAPLNQLVPPEVKTAISSVNDRPWYDGYEKGYWLFDGLSTQAVEPNDAFEMSLCFYVKASFYSQVVHDWSYWQFLQLPNGQYVKVEPSVIDQLVSVGYDKTEPDFRGDGDSVAGGKGVCVTYPYPARDFYGIFGVQ